MSKKIKEKVCLAYEDSNGELQRTRFFKHTSTNVIKNEFKVLQQNGFKPEKVTRSEWEIREGLINRPRRPVAVYTDLSMVEKTREMKDYDHKQKLKRRSRNR